MSIFSYHLVKTSFFSGIRAVMFPLKSKKIPGLIHAETMTAMTLGSGVFSPKRFLVRQVVVFAQWKDEAALNDFLKENRMGKILSKGWHTRLELLRQWGKLSEFDFPKIETPVDEPASPVVAVTIARLKLLQVPRFIKWGRPVEKLVRDHPGTTLSLASIRFPRTISTFSIWKTQKQMTDMVHGHSSVAQPKRHIDAMKERNRKDFHYEFTTLRFKALSEFGQWKGESDFIPKHTRPE